MKIIERKYTHETPNELKYFLHLKVQNPDYSHYPEDAEVDSREFDLLKVGDRFE
jgi:hypothetical protein